MDLRVFLLAELYRSTDWVTKPRKKVILRPSIIIQLKIIDVNHCVNKASESNILKFQEIPLNKKHTNQMCGTT